MLARISTSKYVRTMPVQSNNIGEEKPLVRRLTEKPPWPSDLENSPTQASTRLRLR